MKRRVPEFSTLAQMPPQMTELATTAPTASVNPAATSPEITCQRSRSRWICSVVAALPASYKRFPALFNIFYPVCSAMFSRLLLCEFCEKNMNQGNVLVL